MTDDELVAAWQSNEEEKSFEKLGCGMAIVVVGVIGFVAYKYPGSAWFATFGEMILGAVIAVVILIIPSGKNRQC